MGPVRAGGGPNDAGCQKTYEERAMKQVEISVVIPVGDRTDDLADLHASYREGLDATGATYEMVYVLDGLDRDSDGRLTALREAGEPVKIVKLGKAFGEATALMVGFANARGARLLTLPAYFQVKGREIPKLLAAGEHADMVIGRRW